MLILIVSIFIFYILVFPLKIKLNLTNKNIRIDLYSFTLVNQSIDDAMSEIQEVTVENLQNNLMSKDDLIYLKLFKKLKIKKLDLQINGFYDNYEILSIFYGVFYYLFSSFDYYFYLNKIPFSYSISYDKESYFKVDGIFKTSLGKIILEYFKLRRKKFGRASN